MGGEARYDTVYIMAKDENDLESAGNAAANRIKAVSYTHLDVYKRQGLQSLQELRPYV